MSKKVHVLKTPKRVHCHDAAQKLSQSINEKTIAVGYFIVGKDRTVAVGGSWEAGVTICDLIGASEILKDFIGDAK